MLKDFWNAVNNRQKVSSNILTDSMAVPEKVEGKDVEVITSGGVDRTTLTLGFERHQPDIEAMKLLYGNPDNLIEVRNNPKNKKEKRDVLQNVAQKEEDVVQNVAETDDNVAQNLDDSIIALIQEIPNVRREEMARSLSVAKKTIERHLKDFGISWEGHPKT